jgi:hypothetical protein
MARNMQNKITEYEKTFYNDKKNPTQKGAFYADDYAQLVEIAKKKGGTEYDYIDAALKAGFIMGYKLAQRDAKNMPAKK